MSEKTVTVTVTDFGSFRDDDEFVTLDDLAKAIAAVPEQHRANAVLAVEVYGDYASTHLSLTYKRPETAAELQKRERDSREYQAKSDRERFDRERAEYFRLKAKFEP